MLNNAQFLGLSAAIFVYKKQMSAHGGHFAFKSSYLSFYKSNF